MAQLYFQQDQSRYNPTNSPDAGELLAGMACHAVLHAIKGSSSLS